jgi:hypothetical protein
VHRLPLGTPTHWESVQQLPVRQVAAQQTPVPLLHDVPSPRKTSVGQVMDDPLQTSCASHPPGAAARQTVPAGR